MVTRCFPGCPSAAGPRRAALLLLLFALVWGAQSCGSSRAVPGVTDQPSIGVAYVGPATMNLRQDLAARSASIIEVRHGDRLDILETRRRLVRVRTSAGMAGWVDANLLLSAEQMEQLRNLAESARDLPSQGAATVFDQLNVHTEPNRFSPSFAQIPENGSVEVLGHKVTPRRPSRPKANLVARTAANAASAKKVSRKAGTSLLPFPSYGAAVPDDWERISRPRASDLPGFAALPAAPPPPSDDWNLVRTKDGRVGWVLARMLYMAIPDEVAQYAEGKRIAAYLPVGDVRDGDQLKHNWLWATATSGLYPGEFDGLRVFVWSKIRHRYETAFIERNLTGFYPLRLTEVPGDTQKGFSLLAQDKDGLLYKRTYAFSGYHVRLISKVPASRNDTVPASGGAILAGASPQATQGGWWQKVSAWPRGWFSRR